jgi:hypothetical protein
MIGQTVSSIANTSMISATENLGNVQNFVGDTIGAVVAPQGAKGISGWVFDIAKQDQLDLEADITDHYMEDNSFLNDHKIIKPIVITVTGSQGELVARNENIVGSSANFLESALSEISEFTGDYTDQAIQNINGAISEANTYTNQVNQVVEKTKNMINQFKGEGGYSSLQEKAYKELYAMFINNDLLTVNTPWGFFKNMSIIKIPFVQPEESDSYSDISITLKEMRFAQTKVTQFNDKLFDSRNNMQNADKQDNVKAPGKLQSGLFKLEHGIQG